MRKVCNCTKADNTGVVESSKSSSVMPAVHMQNFKSISVAEELIPHSQANNTQTMPTVYMYRQNYVHTFLIRAQILTHTNNMQLTCIL